MFSGLTATPFRPVERVETTGKFGMVGDRDKKSIFNLAPRPTKSCAIVTLYISSLAPVY